MKPPQRQRDRELPSSTSQTSSNSASDRPAEDPTPRFSVAKPQPTKSGLSQATQLQLLTVGLLVLIVGLLMGVFVRLLTIKESVEQPLPPANNSERLPSDNVPTNSNLGKAPEKITRDRFNKIQKGMTLKQVEEIIGSSGKLIADSSTSEETGQVYSWKNPQGSNAIIEFKDGKVVAKAQAGL